MEVDRTDRLKPVNYHSHLSFDQNGSNFTLNDGCNDVSGGITLGATRLEFKNFSVKRKQPCQSREKTNNARLILETLRNHDYYKVKGDYLIFFKGNKAILVFSKYMSDDEETGWTKRTYKVAAKKVMQGSKSMLDLYDYVDKKHLYIPAISGFEYQPGYEYEINMQITYSNNSTNESSNNKYQLLSVNKKTKK